MNSFHKKWIGEHYSGGGGGGEDDDDSFSISFSDHEITLTFELDNHRFTLSKDQLINASQATLDKNDRITLVTFLRDNFKSNSIPINAVPNLLRTLKFTKTNMETLLTILETTIHYKSTVFINLQKSIITLLRNEDECYGNKDEEKKKKKKKRKLSSSSSSSSSSSTSTLENQIKINTQEILRLSNTIDRVRDTVTAQILDTNILYNRVKEDDDNINNKNKQSPFKKKKK